ncbi:MAG: hypothetical protein JWO46_1802 [Nocardioidaceae bacterium]|nr:hypothetical protein [Nocardioidaceae bacterium]
MVERRVSIRVTVAGRQAERELGQIGTKATEADVAVRAIPNEVKVRGDTSGLSKIERDARRANQSTSALADSITILAPAFTTVSAAAVPALAGLSTELGITAAAVGVGLLAFNHLGEALKALDAARLDPSAANLEKLDQVMAKLSPSARDFAHELDSLRPAIDQLSADAGAGIFPGLTSGLDALESRLPEIDQFVSSIGEALGQIGAETGKELGSDEWDSFFSDLINVGTPVLLDTAHTVGDLAAGVARLWQATLPLTTDFTGGLADAAKDFHAWADAVEETGGASEFMDYVRETGPVVVQTLGKIGNALLQVAEATAPIGGPTLRILGAFADVIAKIAESPIGTPLFAFAAGLAAVNRALAVSALAKNSLVSDLLYGKLDAQSGTRGANALVRTQGQLGSVQTRVRGLGTDLRSMSNEYQGAGRAQSTFLSGLSNTTGAAQRTRASLGSLAKGGALVAGVGIVASGLADKMGLANTATFALAGSFAGPLGAAAGGAVGALTDIYKAGGNVVDVFNELDQAAAGTNVEVLSRRLAAAKAQLDQIAAGDSPADYLGTGAKFLGGLAKGDNIANNGSQIVDADAKLAHLTSTYRGLADLVGQRLPADASPAQIQEFADKIAPALKQAGIDIKEVAKGGFSETRAAADAVQQYLSSTTSVAGEAARIGQVLTTTRLSADQLAASLDAVFSPKLNRAQANDAFIRSLQQLKSELKGASGLVGSSTGALDNRALVNSSASALNAKLKADADAGASSDQLVRKLAKGRQAILDQGEAAGISRRQMRNYLDTLGLTPDLVKTLIELDGATEAQRAIRSVADKLAALKDKNIHVNIIRGGADVAAIVGAAGARGMMVRAHANGDFANRHQPMIARGSTIPRVWAEQETGGEAYIPLRNDSRRPRARAITEATAAHMGGQVIWMNAGGSFTAGDAAAYTASTKNADYAQQVLQLQQQIADAQKALNAKVKKGKNKGKLELTGLARQVKLAELASEQIALQGLQLDASGQTLADAADALDQSAQDAKAAADALDASRTASQNSLFDQVNVFSTSTNPARAVTDINKEISLISQYGQVMLSLKNSGASKALLDQVKAHAEDGDLKGAIKFGNALLAAPLLIGDLNASLAGLGAASSAAASLTNDPSFTGAGAYTGGLTAASFLSFAPTNLTRTVNVNVGYDPSAAQIDIQRMVKYEVRKELEATS